MKFRTILAGLAAIHCAAAFAQSDSDGSQFGVSVGLRGFYNRISGPGYANTGVPGFSPNEASIASDDKLSFLPSVAIRYGSLVFAGSYHVRTSYEANVPEAFGRQGVRRTEWDLSAGYAILPNLILALGWKDADFKVESRPVSQGLSQSFAGPFLGMSLAAPMSGPWSVFGSFAVGRPKWDIGDGSADRSGTYLASEIGLRYALSGVSASFSNASLMLGYRTQSFRFSGVSYSFISTTPTGAIALQNGTHNVRSGIEGVTFGVAFSY